MLKRGLAGLLPLLFSPALLSGDILVKDFDVTLSQEDCRLTAIRLFHSLVSDDVPVMEHGHIISYEGGDSELVAVCRADRGVLVLYSKGRLAEAAQIKFYRAFTD